MDAWDWAGNEVTSSIQVTVNGAAYQPDGPGAVNLTTGDYKLSAGDVGVAGAGGDLSLSRTYDSRQVAQGAGGPLGPQWALSLPDVQASGEWQSLRVMPNGSVQVTAASGGSLVFAASGSGYTAPAGYQTLTLIKGSSSEYRLTNAAGDVSIFTRANSEKEEAPLFVPTGVEQAAGAGGLNKMTYLYGTSEGVTRPVGVVAPEPSGAGWSCASRLEKHEELVNGCRALELVYATETKTGEGEKESEWNEYKGRLSEVVFIAYNLSSKKVARTPVARYLYDKQGRLRAEWNPEIPGPLKTIYGYDSEGHVTAVTGPSLEPWVITYGTASGDATTGRLLRVTQAPESGKLGWRETPLSSEAPKLSGTPVVGVTVGASSGVWSNEPVGYGYQWEDCNSEGKACTSILGATNPNYTVASSDVGHRLVVLVTAGDSGGSVVASSAASGFVTAKAGTYVQGIDSGHSLNAVSCISGTTDCVLSDSAGKALYTTNASSSVPATWSSWSGPSGQSPSQAVDCPTSSLCLLADGKEASGGKLYYATTLGGVWSEAYSPSYGVDAISCASSALCVSGQDSGGYFRYATSPASTHWELEEQGEVGMRGVFCLPSPATFCAIADGSGRVHIATSTSQIESSAWKETDVDGSSALNGVACTSSSSCVAVDGAGNVLDLAVESSGAATESKHDIDGSTSLTAVTCTGGSTCVTVDKAGNAFVSKNSGETWTEQYSFGSDLTSVSCSSTSLCVAGSTTGEAVMFNPTGGEKSEGTHYNAGPGSTIEYHVPLSGTGLSNMTKSEVEKWAQKDVPVEGTAIFPPSKPVGWPASKYEQATIFYIDSSNKTVNTLSAAGGISTAEYDTRGNVTRTLAADDRAKALKESNPAEAAEHLSTISTYNEGSEPGTELQSTLGPEHMIKLKNGNEVQARKHVMYSYEEGAPSEGGPYRLVTKTTEAALVAGKEEDERTVEKAYSGRAGLGWKLHKPTSTTEAPGGLNLTHATAYSTTTGAEIETEMPGADGEGGTSYAFSSEFGSSGTGNGQFNHPGGIAVAPNSDLWVIDGTNDRIEEFTNEGEYLRQAGSKGTGNGQLEDPSAIAVDTHGNVWVADTINYRVEEFNEKGEFMKTFGAHGEEAGKFRFPQGIAIDEHGDVWVSDTLNDRIEEFNEKGEYIKIIAEGKGEPEGLEAVNGDIWVADWSQDRIQEYTESGTLVQQFGSEGTGNGQLQHPYDVAVEAKGNILVADNGNDRVDEFNEKGEYQGQFGAKGLGHFEFTIPIGLAIDSHGDAWVTNPKADTVERWLPPDPTTGNKGAYDSEITYYSPKTEAGVAACENHPEWANLPCQTKPYRQPEVTGLPEIPVTTYTYNMWDEPEITKTTSGSATRTETDTYEPSGRIASREITATTGETLPKVSYKYSTSTGALIKQSTGSGETEKKIESTFNDFGELTAYTDAAGTTSTYKYDIDGRPTETNDGKGTQHYEYSETTGLLAKLTDSSNEAMKFTTTYDPEGNLTEEAYPNGMTAATTYNPVGEATSLEYTKTTNCVEEEKEKCKWFKDTAIPSIHGQWMSQTSTLSKETYNYDETGRLTETHETPAGKHCKTRVYRYDEDGNRLSLTKSESSTETCNSENTTEENHSYDTADQLIDTGVEYNPFGDTTKLPSTDAGGEPLTSRYYADGQLSEQEQHHETIGYKLDPARRTLETVSTGEAASDVTNHYSSEGNSPSWSTEPGEKWARYIQGPTGLSAIQTNGETPVLQIANLHGDIIGTASMSATATKLLSTTDTTEYGVPTSGAPPRYSWLGTKELPTELPSGITAIGARSYAPQLGRFLQPDPTPGGSADAYAYTYGDPLNETDPTGQWTLNQTSGGASAIGGTGEGTTLTDGTGIAANAVMPPPVNTEIETAFQTSPPWDQQHAGTEEYEEYWEEEWEKKANTKTLPTMKAAETARKKPALNQRSYFSRSMRWAKEQSYLRWVASGRS